MKRLLWELRGYFTLSLFLFCLGLMVSVLLLFAFGKENFLEVTIYRMLFFMIQIFFFMAQAAEFRIVQRKELGHRFFRSQPMAWEKEKGRFLRMDGTCLGLAALLFVVSLGVQRVTQSEHSLTLPVILFLCFMVLSRFLLLVFKYAWMIEALSAFVMAIVPFGTVNIWIVVVALLLFCAAQAFLFRFIKKQWYTERTA